MTEFDLFGRDGSVLRLADRPIAAAEALDHAEASARIDELDRGQLVALWFAHGWGWGEAPATGELRAWCATLLDHGWSAHRIAGAIRLAAPCEVERTAPFLHELTDVAPERTREVTLHLFDRRGRRLAGAAYEVEFDGGYISGVSDDGAVVVTVPAATRQVTLRWGRPDDARPDGVAPLEFVSRIYVEVEACGNADEALRRKLHNLGRSHRRLDVAIASFQACSGAAITGRSDDAAHFVDARHDGAEPLTPEDRRQ